MKLELLTNATVVDDAIRFVSSKSSSSNKNEDDKESRELDYNDDQLEKTRRFVLRQTHYLANVEIPIQIAKLVATHVMTVLIPQGFHPVPHVMPAFVKKYQFVYVVVVPRVLVNALFPVQVFVFNAVIV